MSAAVAVFPAHLRPGHRRLLPVMLAAMLLPSYAAAQSLELLNGDFDADAAGWQLASAGAVAATWSGAADLDDAAGSGALAWSWSGAGAAPTVVVGSQCMALPDPSPGLMFEGAARIDAGSVTARIVVEYFDDVDCSGTLLERQVALSTRATGTWKRFRLYEDIAEGPQLLPVGGVTARVQLEMQPRAGSSASGAFDGMYFGPPRAQAAPLAQLVDGFDYAIDPNAFASPYRDEHGLPREFVFGFADAGWRAVNTSDPATGTTEEPGNAADFPAWDGPLSGYVGVPWQVADSGGHISYWLLSPELEFAAGRECVSLFTRASQLVYPERAQIRLSTAGDSIEVGSGPADAGDFTTLLTEINPSMLEEPASCVVGPQFGYPREWCEVRVCGLPTSGTGRIAFRYFVPDTNVNAYYVGVDRFRFPAASALAASTLAITAESADPTVAGQAYEVGVAVTSAAGTPSGSVVVGDGIDSCVATLVNGSGSCTMVSTAAGPRTLSAYYAGDVDFASASASAAHTVTAPSTGATATVLIASHDPDPSNVASGYSVRTTVAGTDAPPTGLVTISDGNSTCSAVLGIDGNPEALTQAAECELVSLVAGTLTLTASYFGDLAYQAAQAQVTHTVVGGTTPVTTFVITGHAPEPSAVGQPYTVSTAVTGGSGTPTGQVTVTDGHVSCSAIVTDGASSCVLASTTAGTKTLTATYSGNGVYEPAVATTSHVVEAGTSTPTVTITADTPDPSTVGQTYTVAVTVAGTAGTPTGIVTISDGAGSCQIMLAGGSGDCSMTAAAIGTLTLTASYGGDSTYAAGGDTESHTVVSADRIFRGGFEPL